MLVEMQMQLGDAQKVNDVAEELFELPAREVAAT